MSGLTPRFGLSYFGGAVRGSINDDGQKYTYQDRLLIDRLFQAIEAHDYTHKTASAPEPGPAPTATLLTDEGGILSAGQLYYYVVSFVDENGLETKIGDEVSISTPAALGTPLTPSAETAAGGALPSGMYYYGITGLRDGEESPLSSPVTATLLPGDGTVYIGLPPLNGADSYQVWRMAATESGYSRVGTTITNEFIDNGSVPPNPCPTDPANQPPQFNQGVNRYSVRIDLSASDTADVLSGNVAAWRLYRSTASGNYGNTSLVHEVIERTDPIDPNAPLRTTWADQGDQLASGRPTSTSQGISLKPFSFPSAATLPSAAGYPAYYPLIVGGQLYAKIGNAWTLVGGGGGTVATGYGLQTGVQVLSPNGRPWLMSVTDAGAVQAIDPTMLRAVDDTSHGHAADSGVLILPSAYDFVDTFDRADQTPLGSPYVAVSGTSKHNLVSSNAVHVGSGNRLSLVNSGTASVDQEAVYDLTGVTAGSECHLMTAADLSVVTRIAFIVGPNYWLLVNLVSGGSATTLAEDYVTGHGDALVTLRVVYTSTTGAIQAYINGTQVHTGTHAVAAGITRTHHGFYTSGVGTKVTSYKQTPSTATV